MRRFFALFLFAASTHSFSFVLKDTSQTIHPAVGRKVQWDLEAFERRTGLELTLWLEAKTDEELINGFRVHAENLKPHQIGAYLSFDPPRFFLQMGAMARGKLLDPKSEDRLFRATAGEQVVLGRPNLALVRLSESFLQAFEGPVSTFELPPLSPGLGIGFLFLAALMGVMTLKTLFPTRFNVNSAAHVVLGVIVLGWLWNLREILFDDRIYLFRDTGDNYLLFDYTTQFLRSFGEFPSWIFHAFGGTWFEVLAHGTNSIAPHRWPAYLLAALTSLSTNLLFKTSVLITGMAILGAGIYLLANELWKKPWLSSLAVALALLTSLGITPLHQEQALATVYFIPYIWVCLLRARTKPWYLVVTAVLVAWSLNNHYPHFAAVYWTVAAALFLRFPVRELREFGLPTQVRSYFRVGLVSSVVFLICVAPVLYAFFEYSNQLASPLRGQLRNIDARTFEEYQKFGWLSAGVFPRYLELYLNPWFATELEKIEPLDRLALYASPGILFALCLLVLGKIRHSYKHLAFVVLLAVLSVGLYGPFPKLLWRLPAFSIFRQWYFFSTILNLHLILLSVAACQWMFSKIRFSHLELRGVLALSVVLAVGIGMNLLGPHSGTVTLLLLLAFSYAPRLLPAQYLGAVSIAGMLVGSALWNLTALNVYRERVPHAMARIDGLSISGPYAPKDFVQRLITDRQPLFKYDRPTAVPNRGDYRAEAMLSLVAPAQWMGSGTLTAASPAQLSATAHGNQLRIQIHSQAEHAENLLILQQNDDRWVAKDAAGHPLKVETGPTGALAIQLPKNGDAIFLRHTPSYWFSLVAAMITVGLAAIAGVLLLDLATPRKLTQSEKN